MNDGIIVAGGSSLEVGKEYGVKNERKGEFVMRISKIDGEWITGIITDGVARAVMSYNVKDVGEEVTVRACHTIFIPV